MIKDQQKQNDKQSDQIKLDSIHEHQLNYDKFINLDIEQRNLQMDNLMKFFNEIFPENTEQMKNDEGFDSKYDKEALFNFKSQLKCKNHLVKVLYHTQPLFEQDIELNSELLEWRTNQQTKQEFKFNKLKSIIEKDNNHYQVPEFLFFKRSNSFKIDKLLKRNKLIDEGGIDFYFSLADLSITHIIFAQTNVICEFKFHSDTDSLRDEKIIDESDGYKSLRVPANTKYLHINIKKFKVINFLGFMQSKYDRLNFCESTYKSLQQSFESYDFNSRILQNHLRDKVIPQDCDNSLNLMTKIDNRMPYLIELQFEDDISVCDDSGQIEFINSLIQDQSDQNDNDCEFNIIVPTEYQQQLGKDEMVQIYIGCMDTVDVDFRDLNKMSKFLIVEKPKRKILDFFKKSILNNLQEGNIIQNRAEEIKDNNPEIILKKKKDKFQNALDLGDVYDSFDTESDNNKDQQDFNVMENWSSNRDKLVFNPRNINDKSINLNKNDSRNDNSCNNLKNENKIPDKSNSNKDIVNMNDKIQDKYNLTEFFETIEDKKKNFVLCLGELKNNIKIHFGKGMSKFSQIGIFKLSKYINEGLVVDQALKKTDHLNLSILNMAGPLQIQRFIDRLSFLFGDRNIIISDNFQNMNDKKDVDISQLIISQCERFIKDDLKDFLSILKQYPYFFENFFVEYNQSLKYLTPKILAGTASISSFTTSSRIRAPTQDKQLKIESGNSPHSYIRLVGLICIQQFNTILADFRLNKKQLALQFDTRDKFEDKSQDLMNTTLFRAFIGHQKDQIDFKQVFKRIAIDNDQVQEHIYSLPYFFKIILHKYSILMKLSECKIDFQYLLNFKNDKGEMEVWGIFVICKFKIALVNNTMSYLQPIPGIVSFKDQAENHLEYDDLISPIKSNVQEKIKEYLNMYIWEESGLLKENLLRDEQVNDIIHNSQFVMFDQSYELRNHMITFIREVQICEPFTFQLYTAKMADFTKDLTVNNDFKLISQTIQEQNFEIFKEYQNENADQQLKFNGLFFTSEDLVRFKNGSKEGSTIVAVCCVVSNRIFHLNEYLIGLYNNLNDPEIQENELVIDIIDFIYNKVLQVPLVIQILLQVMNIFLQLLNVQIQINMSNIGHVLDGDGNFEDDQKNYPIIIQTISITILAFQILFILKSAMELQCSIVITVTEKGFSFQVTALNITVKTLFFSEKILDVFKFSVSIYISCKIFQNITQKDSATVTDNLLMVVSCFLVILNLINFLKQISATQKLIITLIEIFIDLKQTLLLTIILILGLTTSLQGMEQLKKIQIEREELLLFTTELSSTSSYIVPQELQNITSIAQYFFNSIMIAILADKQALQEYEFIADLNKQVKFTPDMDIERRHLFNGIVVMNQLNNLVNVIFVVVIWAQQIVLLNFIIALMSDTFSKVTDNQKLQTQRQKVSIMLQWHQVVYAQIQSLDQKERQMQPWKIKTLDSLASSNEDDWSGGLTVIKKQVGNNFKRLFTDVRKINKLLKTNNDDAKVLQIRNNVYRLEDKVNTLEERQVRIEEKIDLILSHYINKAENENKIQNVNSEPKNNISKLKQLEPQTNISIEKIEKNVVPDLEINNKSIIINNEYDDEFENTKRILFIDNDKIVEENEFTNGFDDMIPHKFN